MKTERHLGDPGAGCATRPLLTLTCAHDYHGDARSALSTQNSLSEEVIGASRAPLTATQPVKSTYAFHSTADAAWRRFTCCPVLGVFRKVKGDASRDARGGPRGGLVVVAARVMLPRAILNTQVGTILCPTCSSRCHRDGATHVRYARHR